MVNDAVAINWSSYTLTYASIWHRYRDMAPFEVTWRHRSRDH